MLTIIFYPLNVFSGICAVSIIYDYAIKNQAFPIHLHELEKLY